MSKGYPPPVKCRKRFELRHIKKINKQKDSHPIEYRGRNKLEHKIKVKR
jgi:hypothetical protein